MHLGAALLLAHLIGDFPLQTNWLYRLKNRSWVGVFLHVLVHLFTTAFLLERPLTAWPLLLILGILHFIVDFIKVRTPQKYPSFGFTLDQLTHVVIIACLAYFWNDTIIPVLSLPVLKPLILYGIVLGSMVFLWVVACEVADSAWGRKRYVIWARANLLRLSQFAGLPLLLLIVLQVYRLTQRVLS